MTSQQLTKQKPTSETIGIFDDRKTALEAKEAIEATGVTSENVSITAFTSGPNQLDAMGTTVGGEVAFWLGGAYGGVIGLVTTLTLTTWTSLPDNSNLGRLIILGFTVVGAILGLIGGKRFHAKQPIKQQQKGDPSIPQSFKVTVAGSSQDIEKANNAIDRSKTTRMVGQA